MHMRSILYRWEPQQATLCSCRGSHLRPAVYFIQESWAGGMRVKGWVWRLIHGELQAHTGQGAWKASCAHECKWSERRWVKYILVGHCHGDRTTGCSTYCLACACVLVSVQVCWCAWCDSESVLIQVQDMKSSINWIYNIYKYSQTSFRSFRRLNITLSLPA